MIWIALFACVLGQTELEQFDNTQRLAGCWRTFLCDCATNGFCLEQIPCPPTSSPSASSIPSPAPSASPDPTPSSTPHPSPTSSAIPTPTAVPSPTPSPLTPPAQTPDSLAPIARWLTVPGEGLCGVVAEHRSGVWGVVLTAAGQPLVVTTPTVEPTTGLRGYWFSAPPGPVTATVIGLDGGRRDLGANWVGPGAGAVRVIRGQTLRAGIDDVGSGAVWLDGCTILGDGVSRSHPVGGNAGPVYFTNCTIRDCWRAQGSTPHNAMMRGCRIFNTREDVAQGCYLLFDVTITGVDPGSTGDHADAVQLGLATHSNAIFYRVVATDLHYQSLFIRGAGTSRGLAIVDCTFAMAAPLRMPGAAGCAISGVWDHVVIRNSVFTNPWGNVNESAAFALWQEKDSAGVKRSGLTNSDVSGNVFGSWAIGATVRAAIPAGTFTHNTWGTTRKDEIP